MTASSSMELIAALAVALGSVSMVTPALGAKAVTGTCNATQLGISGEIQLGSLTFNRGFERDRTLSMSAASAASSSAGRGMPCTSACIQRCNSCES
jgi:hypothetical protein